MKLRTRTIVFCVGGFALGGCNSGTLIVDPAPFVEITSPLTQVVRGRVSYSANALDDLGVPRVRFLVDGALLVVDSLPPYVTEWDTTTATAGQHTLRVEAEDLEGNRSSASRVVIVNNATPN